MKQISVLAKNKSTYFIQRLTEEVGREGVSLFDPWTEDPSTFRPPPVLLCRTTGVHLPSADLEFLKHLNQKIRVVNSVSSLELFRSKKSQYEFFEEARVPVLPWMDLLTATPESIRTFTSAHPSIHYLIKPHRGQGGWGVRVMGKEALSEWFSGSEDLEYVLQPYLDYVPEWRFFFIKEGWSQTLERIKTPGHTAANFRQEGEARKLETPEVFREIIREVERLCPLDYGAMDVLMTKDGPRVLEINVVPGIEQLEAITGHNVIKSLLSIL